MEATFDARPAAILLAPSLGKFTRFKWLVAGVLAVALILLWMTGAGRRADDLTEFPGGAAARAGAGAAAPAAMTRSASPGAGVAGAPASGTASAASSAQSPGASTPMAGRTDPGTALLLAPALTIERSVDGRISLSGTAPDEGTRDEWLNAVRIAAQGKAVAESIRISPVIGSAPWSDRLREATTLLRERRLDSVSFEGDRLTLRGPRVASSYQDETERLFREELPAVASVATAGEGLPAGSLTSRRSGVGADAPATGVDNPVKAASIAPTNRSSAASGSATGSGATVASGKSAGSGAPGEAIVSGRAPDSSSGAASSRSAAAVGAATSAGGSASGRAASAAASGDSGAGRQSVAACPAKLAPLAATVYFRVDSVMLSRAERQRLEQLGQCLGKRKVVVTGHTDNRHSKSHNLDLSRRRADSVSAAIVAGGAAPTTVTTRAAGESRPAANGSDARARQRNRRVEISLR